MRVRATWRVAAAASTLALILVACGDGDIEDTPSAADAETTTPESDEDDAEPSDEGNAEPSDAGAESGEELSADLLGAGASFPDPVYQEWIGEYTQLRPGVSVQYESIGSGGGREQFIGQQTDFAGSDAFMDDDEIAAAVDARGCGEVLHIPAVFGGVVVAYNIEGLDQITLDAATTADIFSGEITNINDPAIAELNPDIELPDQELTVNVRADGSGTTETFAMFLENEDEDWAAEYGADSEIDWFSGVVASEQNDGVSAAIAQQPGGIGYLSLDFAVQQGLPTALMINEDGNPIEASPESVGAAADTAELPDDLRFNLLDIGGEGYPISTATWMLAYTCGYDEDTAAALIDYMTWGLEEGDAVAAELGYAPLSDTVQELSLEKVNRINADG